MDKKKTPKLVNLVRGILLRLAVHDPVEGDNKGSAPLCHLTDDKSNARVVSHSLIPDRDFRACYEALTFNRVMGCRAAFAMLERYEEEAVDAVKKYLEEQCG